MTERISIFNYEAFYLDFLEGNLNSEDTALLFDFFEAHPECRMENEELLAFEPERVALPNQVKSGLKQTSEEEQITLSNVDHFLIAASEGILDTKKASELQEFVRQNKLEKELILTQATYFKPDHSLVYHDKASLKHEAKQIALWPLLFAAAASLILAVVVITLNSESVVDLSKTPVAKQEIKPDERTPNGVTNNARETQIDPLVTSSGPVERIDPDRGINVKESRPNGSITQQLPTRELLASIANRDIEPLTVKLITNSGNERAPEATQDLAKATPDDMTNPIKPITKYISEKTNTEVDFRSGKPSGKNNGFFLKVGNLEVSRRKY